MEKDESSGEVYNEQLVTMIKLTVKFSGRSIPVNLSLDSTIKDLKILLQPLTNVLPRGQKLIFSGKVLEDEKTLRLSELKNGSKIMLIASQGLHQGDGPIKKEATEVPMSRRRPESNKDRKPMSVQKNQFQRWMATGVLGLSESGLKIIPQEVWNCGASVRILDLSHNSIVEVPCTIIHLTSLQKLILNDNNISDDQLSWEALAQLKSLTALSLSHNQLRSLPSTLGLLKGLTHLHVANNELTCLPAEIGFLTNLQVLKANNNRIITLPSSIGSCISLFEVDLSSNLLVDLPDTISKLQDLKALYLNHNGLKCLPATLLKLCTRLSTLELHGTEITMDLLRQFEGWESFDERRRLKVQKQLDSRAGNSAAFDEGADKS
ncbi:LRR repeats and ubiquitin-like domain-containing protein [Heracleum sosnowskyi]|uniref:LRR repeats and ubiquitin-like domain-containing protein n=1 Tax=Heracleum sosnowskyi TaxID=360622 RepID=A0AAD8N6L3_9APIA|nr:LRR repeats and ubiquitin-like domain-containing protein [Heracleum sosnowskyi]